MPHKVKNLLKTLAKKVKTKLSKFGKKREKTDKDIELEYLQICKNLRSRGMVSLRTVERDIVYNDILFAKTDCVCNVIVRCED